MTDEAPQSQPLLPPPPALWQRRETWIALSVMMAILILGFLFLKRRDEAERVSKTVPVVAVATVDREDLYKEVTIPAEFRPYVEAELNAKVSGYLSVINVDFGDKVKAGQLLAVLEVPELQDELNAAIAAEKRTEADYTNAI